MSGDLPLLLMLAGVLAVAGTAAGLLAGLLGVGGGIVMVPILYFVFGVVDSVDEAVRMHMAVGTSLAAMIPTSISSARAHHARGAVDAALFLRWLPGIAFGVLAGVIVAGWVKGPVLMGLFAVSAVIIALHMLFGRESWRLADALPGPHAQRGMAAGIAGVSVMMGIGGGTFTVPVLTLFGYPIHRAVGTAAAIGVLIAIPGAIGFAATGWDAAGRPPGSLGYASLVGVAALIPTTMLAAPWGVALAHRLSRIWLRRAFAVFLGLTAMRMAASLAGL